MADLPSWMQFWGKARPANETTGPHWHPVAYHLLDVAAVADVLLVHRPRAASLASALLGLDPRRTRELLVAFVALHDLGKFGRAFQAQVPELWPAALGAIDVSRARTSVHTVDGLALWEDHLAGSVGERFSGHLASDNREALGVLAQAIFGHHGRPAVWRSERSADSLMGRPGRIAALECAEAVLGVVPQPCVDRVLDTDAMRRASWWAAGFVTLCDWIGSRQSWFPYKSPDQGLGDYWLEARASAESAIRAAGVVAPKAASLQSFEMLTRLGKSPTPGQVWAEDVHMGEGQFLAVIEDVTGSGKTEASNMLVHRLMVERRALGAYWAMPTQATANAMYNRQASTLAALFDSDIERRPSLVLAHGQSRLHASFRATVLDAAPVLKEPPNGAPSASNEELPAEVSCPAFLADDGRASLLADVGAGTIDQALLGILPSKYNTLRLMGLAEKVLVVDEAHAYDPYVTSELLELLHFQAALGGSAVVLSATLLERQRAALVRAWRSGLLGRRRAGIPGMESSSAYPLATTVTADGVIAQTAIEAAAWSRRDVPVRFVTSMGEAVALIADATRRGAAVAWVRNTVDSCVEAADAVRAAGVDHVMVFHARFAQCDRQRREDEVIETFGKESTPENRRGRVLLATQVIEQSLDLDFDLLVSDLAPMDLLIQRAGRLWRHTSREKSSRGAEGAELIVLAPPTDGEVTTGWLDGVLPKVRFVYPRIDVLWRTACALRANGVIQTPGSVGEPASVRSLIEFAYGEHPVPEVLQPAADKADGRQRAEGATGAQVTLDLDGGYHGFAKGFVDEARVPTRLGDRTTVRLARASADGRLGPWDQAESSPVRAWARSEVTVRRGFVPNQATASDRWRGEESRIRTGWGAYDQDVPLLPLLPSSEDESVWEGELQGESRSGLVRFIYSAARGLRQV